MDKLPENNERENFFKVPDGYFEDLPRQVRKKLTPVGEENIAWYQLPSLQLAVAASVLILISSIWLFVGQPFTENEIKPELEVASMDFSKEEIIDHLIDYGLTYSEILNNVSSEDIIYETTEEELLLIEESLLDNIEWTGDYSEIEIDDI